MPLRSHAVPRHNGAPTAVRLALRHDFHGLATVVPGLSSLPLLLLRREPRAWRGPFTARFVAGLVVWRRGELRQEIERGAWYVLPPDAHLALRKPSEGLWEELVCIKLRANRV